jgi:hypothetical protein
MQCCFSLVFSWATTSCALDMPCDIGPLRSSSLPIPANCCAPPPGPTQLNLGPQAEMKAMSKAADNLVRNSKNAAAVYARTSGSGAPGPSGV